jgi:hypothetical protein
MKFLLTGLIFSLPILAFASIELSPATNAICQNQGAEAECGPATKLYFDDVGSCACLAEGQFRQPRVCMIGYIRCDEARKERFSWLYEWREMQDGVVRKITVGCGCFATRAE